MGTIDELMSNIEKKEHISRDIAEKIVLLSTIDVWKGGTPFAAEHKRRFDSAVMYKAKRYAERFVKDSSLAHYCELRIKESLIEYSREFRNYMKMDGRGINQTFSDALSIIKNRYESILEQKAT